MKTAMASFVSRDTPTPHTITLLHAIPPLPAPLGGLVFEPRGFIPGRPARPRKGLSHHSLARWSSPT